MGNVKFTASRVSLLYILIFEGLKGNLLLMRHTGEQSDDMIGKGQALSAGHSTVIPLAISNERTVNVSKIVIELCGELLTYSGTKSYFLLLVIRQPSYGPRPHVQGLS